MRISHRQVGERVLADIEAAFERLNRYQRQVASGRRVTRPADDPQGTAAALGYRAVLLRIGQHLAGIDRAQGWLSAADAALNDLTQTLQRARELAVQGASDTLSADDRRRIALEVRQLLGHTFGLSKTMLGSRYIFSGFKVTTPPYNPLPNEYDVPAPPPYQGDGGQMPAEIEAGTAITVNLTADVVFSPAIAALIQLRDALDSGSSAAVEAALPALDQAINTAVDNRVIVGARLNRLEAAASRLQDLKLSVTGLKSNVEDVDFAEATTQLAMAETAYRAALMGAARVIQPSLLEFLK
jgi:flagellar hook-associated protein 3 FlgL